MNFLYDLTSLLTIDNAKGSFDQNDCSESGFG